MEYLRRIAAHAARTPDAIAIRTSDGESMTYRDLWLASDAIVGLIDAEGAGQHAPVAVYGHKSPLMVASFLACLKSGRPYVPIDCHSVPVVRASGIVSQLGEGTIVLAVEPLDPSDLVAFPGVVVDSDRIGRAVAVTNADAAPVVDATSGSDCASMRDETRWVDGDDLAYILFTSGSTGAPKGVQVSASCVDNFCRWALTLGGTPRKGRVYLNQAPFSFDLSVYELSMALWSGGSLYCLTKGVQADFSRQFAALGESGAQIWVSTPSFADMCLADKSFGAGLMPDVETFLFCGEVLSNATARRLKERFPEAVVVNSYGPTESTVAVTGIVVTDEMASSDEPLPCGEVRPGTWIRILAPDGGECGVGQLGEIVIEGDTVAFGYLGRDDLTAAAFGEAEHDGMKVRTYRTGDEGFLDEAGVLHCRGRLDLQVKLNGYRIELGEIEEVLRRLPDVRAAAVVPAVRQGKTSHLVAHVSLESGRPESEFEESLALKNVLKERLPHYMIPRKVVFHDSLPVTPNGKIDRKALAAR